MASADLAAALTECDREPIHALGRVQAFGALIAVNDAFAITYCSANVAEVLGLATTVQPDLSLSQVLDGPAVIALQQLVTSLDAGDSVVRSFALSLNPELQVDVAAYRSGQNLVFEFEPHRPAERQDYIAQLRPIFDRLAKAQSQDELLQSAARQLQALIGFDRVMVYRFAADGHGEVAAECHAPGMESLAGLR